MRWIVSYYSGMAVSVISAVLLGFIFKFLTKEIAIASLILGIATFTYILFTSSKISSGFEKKDFNFWSVITIIIFILFSCRAFLWLVFKTGDNIKILSPNNLGDLSLHINYIQYLVNGVRFWPDNSIFTGDKIRYALGTDLFNSLLVLAGFDIYKSLVFVGILGALATGLALFIWGRTFAVAGFLFNGGLVGFTFFQSFKLLDYQSELAWKSIPLCMFITQRGLLYSIPVGLLLLISFKNKYFSKEEDANSSKYQLPLWIEVVLYSALPFFHLHSFIYISLLLAIWVVILNKDKKFEIIKLFGFSFPIAAFFVLLLTNFLKASSIAYIKWGWMQGKQNFFMFWLTNFGIFWPLIFWLCYRLVTSRKENSSEPTLEEAFVFPAIFLFVLFCNLMLAPWDWDNSKLLIWSYLILLPFLWNELISKRSYIEQYVMCFVLFFSGFICLLGGFPSMQGYDLAKNSENTEIAFAIKKLPIEGRFASFPTFNHPLLFCGRKVALGYPGWLWSHGYKVNGKDEKLKRLMMGESDWYELAKELGIKYIFWGNREQNEYLASKKPWETSRLKIVESNWGEVFDLDVKQNNVLNN